MRKARSARGELVDFDLLAIKKQLASAPVAVGVDDRRKFIDEKDGIRTIKTTTVVQEPEASALSLGIEAAEKSAAASKKK